MFHVKGVAPSDTECELHLLVEDKDVAPVEPITGAFDAIFYVSFCKQQYTLQPVCNGKIMYEKTVIFPDEATKQPYDFGKIQRKSRKDRDAKP